jgi:hypothetical protein
MTPGTTFSDFQYLDSISLNFLYLEKIREIIPDVGIKRLLIDEGIRTPIVVSIPVDDNITHDERVLVRQNTLCVPEIDVVYTWVNGSDPRHTSGLFPLFVPYFFRTQKNKTNVLWRDT